MMNTVQKIFLYLVLVFMACPSGMTQAKELEKFRPDRDQKKEIFECKKQVVVMFNSKFAYMNVYSILKRNMNVDVSVLASKVHLLLKKGKIDNAVAEIANAEKHHGEEANRAYWMVSQMADQAKTLALKLIKKQKMTYKNFDPAKHDPVTYYYTKRPDVASKLKSEGGKCVVAMMRMRGLGAYAARNTAAVKKSKIEDHITKCNSGVALSCNAYGLHEYKAGNISSARKAFTKSCDGGNKGGCNILRLIKKKYGDN
jgi:hypothetical protein